MSGRGFEEVRRPVRRGDDRAVRRRSAIPAATGRRPPPGTG